jgi:hypothetical protein
LGVELGDATGPVTVLFGNLDDDKDYELTLVLLGVKGVDSSDFLGLV